MLPPVAVELLTALSKALIVAKLLASRPQDLADARSLWRAHRRTLDAPSIRATLRLLEEALDQSDLLPAFDSIVSEDAPG